MDPSQTLSQFGPEDERVKDLQKLAWSIQSLGNKPGSRIPEAVKRDSYRLASRALSLCSDVAYTEEADFAERSKIFTKQLEDKKKELERVDEEEKAKLTGKCYRAAPGGNYVVGSVQDRSAASGPAEARSLSSTAGGARALTVAEVTARCAEDPEALFLCSLGLGDGDVEPLCDGLKRSGAGLTTLDVSHNLLADVGVQKLVSALAAGACPKLRELHIGCNSFGDLGAQMLTGGLKALRRDLEVHLEASDGQGQQAAPAAPAACADPGSAEPSREAVAGRPAPLEADGASPSVAVASGGYARSDEAEEVAPPRSQPASQGVSEASRDGTRELQATETGAPAAASAVQVDVLRAKSGEGLEVRAVVPLPDGVASAGDLDVDVSAWRLLVRTASGAPVADAALPCSVVTESSQAAFSRKRRTLTITLQPADAAAAAAALGA